MSRRRDDEAGLASAEWALVLPALLVLIMLSVQVAVWAHAARLATAAAEEGLVAARGADGSAAAGEDRARAVLAQLGPNLVTKVRVESVRSDQVASVDVHGYATGPLSFLRMPVDGHATAVIERFVPEGRR